MDLSDLIARNAAFTPSKPAIRFQGRVLTYAGFADRIAACARALKSRLGVGRGDRVAILAANHPDYLVLLYACARLGAMLVPSLLRPPEGCKFRPRCPHAFDQCAQHPGLEARGGDAAHLDRCWLDAERKRTARTTPSGDIGLEAA